MRAPIAFVVLGAAVIALLTWAVGWWSVPLVALAAGAVDGARGGVGRRTALAAAVAWGTLLLVDAMSGRMSRVATPLAATMRVPSLVLVVVTLAFPALLAWSGATIGAALRRR